MANFGYIQLTRHCNQKCLFCSNPERDATISLSAASGMIDYFKKIGYAGVILTGGEPTLHEKLPEIIRLVKKAGLQPRLITNGNKTSDAAFLHSLVKAGLKTINVSIHSCRRDVQDFLADTQGAFERLVKTFENVRNSGIELVINTTINAYNASHLHETVEWIVELNPDTRHFIWNNLDPLMNRAAQNPHTIAKLSAFELSLFLALQYLESTGRTFRVERVPLCYMADYPHASTETRKIVKQEERTVFFLDEKKKVRQKSFFYSKAAACEKCLMSPICAGLYEMGTYYDPAELYPLFIEPEPVRMKILAEVD